MAKSLMDILVDKTAKLISDSLLGTKDIGKYGEKLTERELKWVKLFGRDGKILRNVYLPKGEGSEETSEVDVIFITQKGIFVFESKNYSGWIFGNESDTLWTATLANGDRNKFYNPILQNKTHIKWMREFVGDKIPLFSIIVFSERCELKKITMESMDVEVIQRDQTHATVRDIWDQNPDVLTKEEVTALYEKLYPLTQVSQEVKDKHVERIQEKYIK
jgi:hypothetical protein